MLDSIGKASAPQHAEPGYHLRDIAIIRTGLAGSLQYIRDNCCQYNMVPAGRVQHAQGRVD